MDASRALMERHGVATESLRLVDHDVATGVWPDMTEHGAASDEWPQIQERVFAADILVIAGPIWLGDNSSVTKRCIERLYATSSQLNSAGQYAYYGRVAGCLITGNEDGIKHCAMNILYSLQHLGYTIPPQADAGWIGEAGPGPSYLDPGSGGPENDFTNRNTTFMTWNLMHLARLLKSAGGFPAQGNQRPRGMMVSASTGRTPNTDSDPGSGACGSAAPRECGLDVSQPGGIALEFLDALAQCRGRLGELPQEVDRRRRAPRLLACRGARSPVPLRRGRGLPPRRHPRLRHPVLARDAVIDRLQGAGRRPGLLRDGLDGSGHRLTAVDLGTHLFVLAERFRACHLSNSCQGSAVCELVPRESEKHDNELVGQCVRHKSITSCGGQRGERYFPGAPGPDSNTRPAAL